MEPVLKKKRSAPILLCTSVKSTRDRTPRTPGILKNMSRMSLSEPRNRSISKNEGSKLSIKRAVKADQGVKNSPKKVIPKSKPKMKPTKTHKSTRKLTDKDIEEILSMELQESSDEEIPTLIRQQAMSPKKTETRASAKRQQTRDSVFENDEKVSSTRSKRGTRGDVNNYTQEETPVKNTPTIRSTRKSITLLVKKTPKKVIHKLKYNSDDIKPTPKTPKTRTPGTPRASSVKTPQRGRRIAISQLTPALHAREHSVDKIEEFLNEDKSLPGRETELRNILCFVRSKLHSGTSGCMYISGLPGTGKTATVNSALSILKEEADLPDFNLVEVNGLKITAPRQAYVHILKQLTGKTVAWEQACKLLTTRFTAADPRRVPTVLLVDELDALCKRKQDVVYCIMDWANRDSALLTVLAIANTIDLPERILKTRVASRLGLTRLDFKPYTHAQLQRIVALRLTGAALGLTADAMDLIARKVAAVTGDARRALSLCTRTLEHAAAERAGAGQGAAGLQHVQAALDDVASSAIVHTIQHCSPAERLLLRALAAEVERTGTDETTLPRVLANAEVLAALDGRPYRCAPRNFMITPSQAHTIFMRLYDMRLVIMKQKPTGAKLMLNVSVDDIYYATKPM